MGSLDPAKILVILIVALLVMGPQRLPVVARQLGSILREFVKIREQVLDEVKSAIPDDLPRIPTPRAGAISNFVSGLTKPDATSAEKLSSNAPSAAPEGDLTTPVVSPGLADLAFVPDDPSMN